MFRLWDVGVLLPAVFVGAVAAFLSFCVDFFRFVMDARTRVALCQRMPADLRWAVILWPEVSDGVPYCRSAAQRQALYSGRVIFLLAHHGLDRGPFVAASTAIGKRVTARAILGRRSLSQLRTAVRFFANDCYSKWNRTLLMEFFQRSGMQSFSGFVEAVGNDNSMPSIASWLRSSDQDRDASGRRLRRCGFLLDARAPE
jgi:hypothetical protein